MTTNLVLILIILFQIKRIDSLFVSVGDYSGESIPGLNGPECGLNVKPIIIEWSLSNKCFQREYKNKTLVFFDKPKVKPQINQRVWKGVDVRHISESPWVVYVGPTHWFMNAGTCSGALITPFWVLTAAHCFEYIKSNFMAGIVLTMGSTTKEGTHKIKINPDSFYAHPEFVNPELPGRKTPPSQEELEMKRSFYDIALIKISGFLPNTNHDNNYLINTICLPNRDEYNNRRENATYYGYGRINDKDEYPDYLQKGWVNLLPWEECPSLFCGRFLKDNPRPCKGDSGGPLVYFVPGKKGEKRAVLIGILRSGEPKDSTCSHTIKLTYWTAVSRHIDWMLKTMKEN